VRSASATSAFLYIEFAPTGGADRALDELARPWRFKECAAIAALAVFRTGLIGWRSLRILGGICFGAVCHRGCRESSNAARNKRCAPQQVAARNIRRSTLRIQESLSVDFPQQSSRNPPHVVVRRIPALTRWGRSAYDTAAGRPFCTRPARYNRHTRGAPTVIELLNAPVRRESRDSHRRLGRRSKFRHGEVLPSVIAGAPDRIEMRTGF
jgi:hypothetical protein